MFSVLGFPMVVQVVERGIPEIRGTEAQAGGVFSKLTGVGMDPPPSPLPA